MKSPRRSANPLPLREPCERRLKAYTLAATTAGASALALANPAEAKVIYTPAHVLIGTTEGVQNYRLDLNHDGIGDATLGASFWDGQDIHSRHRDARLVSTEGAPKAQAQRPHRSRPGRKGHR